MVSNKNSSRRLRCLALLSLLMVLAACSSASQQAAPATSTVETATSATTEPATEGEATAEKNSAASASSCSQASGKVVLATTNDAAAEEPFFTAQMEAFMAAHPNIEVELRFYPGNQYANAINLLFQSNDVPDIFRLSSKPQTQLHFSYEQGRLAPLNKYVTDEFTARFPEGTFDPKASGLYVGDELYALPLVHGKWGPVRPLLYNPALLKQHGIAEPPKTWGELREAATKITKEGNGQVYGFAMVGKGLAWQLQGLLPVAGVTYNAGLAGINLKTGESNVANEGSLATIQFIRQLYQDEVMTPGWEAWGAPEVFQQFAAGRLAMYIGAAWNVAEIKKLNPEIEMGIVPLPVPDDGRKAYQSLLSTQIAYWGLTSAARNPDAAWCVLEYMSTPEFHRAFYEQVRFPTVLIDSYKDIVDEDTQKLLAVAEETLRTSPNPTVRNPEAASVTAAFKANAPTPRIAELYGRAILDGEKFSQLAETYDAQMAKIFEEQLTRAQADGVQVTRETYIFADWDPMQNYY